MNRRSFLSALAALPVVGPALVVAASRTRSLDNIEPPKLVPAFSAGNIDGKARFIIQGDVFMDGDPCHSLPLVHGSSDTVGREPEVGERAPPHDLVVAFEKDGTLYNSSGQPIRDTGNIGHLGPPPY